MLSRASLQTIPADDALSLGEHRNSLRSQDSRGSGSTSQDWALGGDDDLKDPIVTDHPVDVEIVTSFSDFSFPDNSQSAPSPVKRGGMARPTLETIQSDDSNATTS
jgi:hypothetical protein